MPNYVVPQVLVYQDFNLVPATSIRPLPAFICGGHAHLLRYAEADEKSLGFLGYYDSEDEQNYSWPDRVAGDVIDVDYTKLYVEDALLMYFDDALGGGTTITKSTKNRVISDGFSFVDNTSEFPRDADLLDRDVKVGDVAHIRTADISLWTYVNGFAGEVVASSIAAATDDAANANTQSASASGTQTAGTVNSVEVDAASAAGYNGLITGDIDEVYTVTVTSSSIGGDATTARLRVVSASGNDDMDDVTPAAFDDPTDIGSRGATVTWTSTADDFVVGQKFQITVHQAFTACTFAKAGTYTGKKDTVYIVTVSRGGTFAGSIKPQIMVSTTNGYDVSGPTTVTTSAAANVIGTKGATLAFTGAALVEGDKYYVAATAATVGAMTTLILGHDISSDVAIDDEVSLTLYIRKNIQVTANRTGEAPLTNWEQSETELTVTDGITAYDSTWTDSGTPVALPVYSASAAGYGKLYVEYRSWVPTLSYEVNSISDVANLHDSISGSLTPDNPLKWGVFKALENSNGQPVAFASVADPSDEDSWIELLELIDGRDDVYGLVPLTHNQTVLDLFVGHVNSQSSPEFGRWRVLWTSLVGVPTKKIVSEETSSDDEVVLATLADDPNTSGTQYTLLSVPENNSDFIANEVRPGDILRYLYTSDGFGNEEYEEFVVDSVISENSLLLLSGNGVAVGTAQKIEIWRNLTKTEQATEIGQKAGAYSNRRVRAVWPDVVSSGGTEMDGYHLCAALAGQCSGVVPQQSLTHLAISGFDDVSRTVDTFNRTQLNIMAGDGVWIVTRDLQSGSIYTRQALTTAAYVDINAREEMVVRNVDSISYQFQDRFAPFIGVSNVTPTMLDVLRTEALAIIQFLRSNYYTQKLGGQLIDAEIVELRASFTAADRVVMAVNLTIPYAMNNLEIHLVV